MDEKMNGAFQHVVAEQMMHMTSPTTHLQEVVGCPGMSKEEAEIR